MTDSSCPGCKVGKVARLHDGHPSLEPVGLGPAPAGEPLGIITELPTTWGGA